VLIEPNYRGHRIEVNAVAEGDRWNAEVRIRQHAIRAKPNVHTVACFKVTAKHAEASAAIWAKRWIDLQLRAPGEGE